MLNDYLSDLHFWETLGLIMFGSILLWSIFSGISSLIQHWRRPERPDAPAPLPTVRISSGIESGKSPINGKCRFRRPSGLCGLMTTSSPAISTECSCSQEAFVPARLFMSAAKPNVKYWRLSVRSAISTRPRLNIRTGSSGAAECRLFRR